MDANEISAKAMEAMLSGDMAEYDRLNGLLAEKQLKGTHGTKSDNVQVLEEIDAAGRHVSTKNQLRQESVRMKGKLRGQTETSAGLAKDGDKVTGFYGADDEVDLNELVRREKVGGTDNYERNYASNIMKAGKRYREAASDEDEAYDLGKYEHKSKKMDAKKFEEKERRNQIRDTRRLAKNLQSCEFCVDSQVHHRVKDAILAQSPRAMVMVDKMKHSTAFDQLIILPTNHCHAITHLEDDVYDEIRNYQKCVIEFFKKKKGMSVIFMETARYQTSNENQLLGGGPHCRIECYPVPTDAIADAKIYFKKALQESESEWSQHKKLIETTNKGVRRHVPKGFTYFWVDFELSGGFAHVIEDNDAFPRSFGKDVICGVLELDRLERPYRDAKQYWNEVRTLKDQFKNYCWFKASNK